MGPKLPPIIIYDCKQLDDDGDDDCDVDGNDADGPNGQDGDSDEDRGEGVLEQLQLGEEGKSGSGKSSSDLKMSEFLF